MSDGSQKSLVDIALSDRTGSKTLLTLTCLLGTWLLGFGSRLFAVIRFESIIHEFDPWFNYRATHHLSGRFLIENTKKSKMKKLKTFERIWFLWISELVWWNCMVSVRTNCRGYSISRSHDYCWGHALDK